MHWFRAAVLATYLASTYAEQPSLSQLGSVIDKINDNSVSGFTLKYLYDNARQSLSDAISTANDQAQEWLQHVLNPELSYSYGKSPPVYPSRMSFPFISWPRYVRREPVTDEKIGPMLSPGFRSQWME